MTNLQIAALVTLAFYIAWNIAFYAEGHRPQGSAGLKTIGFFGDLGCWTVLIWVLFS